MRIAVIGGGIAGLTAAYDLANAAENATITIYEAKATLGGLAVGFRGRPEWEWPLEHFYHHIFTNDDAILELTKELGLSDIVEIHDPSTVMYYNGKNYPFDSPLRLLMFPHLPMHVKIRMGMVLAYLRFHPNPPWQSFDRQLADQWLERWMGAKGYDLLWRPMLQGKFDAHYDRVNLAWFWARIFKRTPQLGYYTGGFQAFVDGLAAAVEAQRATIHTETPVQKIEQNSGGGYQITPQQGEPQDFDVVLSTVSPRLMGKLTPELPPNYLQQLNELTSMGAVVLTVAIDRQLMADTYWVNVPKPSGIPFLALVEHTNMIDAKYYGGDHLLYLGNYLDADHRYFQMSADELLEEFLPHMTVFNKDFDRSWVTGAWVHAEAYAQPVPDVGYLEKIPDIRTPLDGLYFASMSQVYPWDRGTNYAVEMGRKVAKMIQKDVTNPETV